MDELKRITVTVTIRHLAEMRIERGAAEMQCRCTQIVAREKCLELFWSVADLTGPEDLAQ